MALTGSRVVVVGGSSGIGLGVAEAVLSEGAQVVIVGRSPEKLEAAQKNLGKPKLLKAVTADVTVESDVKQLFDCIDSIDHLVVTRGIVPVAAPVETLNLDAVRRFVDVMLVSSLCIAKHSKAAIRKHGSITFTSGISKDRPSPGGSVVAAVAGSFGYLARALALELAPVRVNVVSPGWVQTPMWDEIVGVQKTAIWSEMAARLPAGRIASPADVAPAYLYLMQSAFTTGTVLDIDGGHGLL